MYKARFDKAVFTQYFDDSKDEFVEIINEYLKSHNDIINSLATTFEKNTEEFCNTLHYHSSAFMYVGFPQLSLDCLDFERKCMINDRMSMKEEFTSLLNSIRDTKSILNKEMFNPSTPFN
jgi:hypothetical protein